MIPLTEKQLRIAGLAAEGHTNKEIATVVSRDVKTVNTHLEAVYAKLGLLNSWGNPRVRMARWYFVTMSDTPLVPTDRT